MEACLCVINTAHDRCLRHAPIYFPKKYINRCLRHSPGCPVAWSCMELHGLHGLRGALGYLLPLPFWANKKITLQGMLSAYPAAARGNPRSNLAMGTKEVKKRLLSKRTSKRP